MAIRSSGYFNNPQFAQAASNLSALFAPPSGADASGWANANAKREEAMRLADHFDYRLDPNFDQETFDRGGVALGLYAPNQSYHAVGVDDGPAAQVVRIGGQRCFDPGDGAVEIDRALTPDGTKIMNATIQIGDSRIMLNDEFPEMNCKGPRSLGGSPFTLHLYVEDADAAVADAELTARALAYRYQLSGRVERRPWRWYAFVSPAKRCRSGVPMDGLLGNFGG